MTFPKTIFAFLFLLCSPAWASWSLTHVAHTSSCNIPTCTVTVTSTTNHNTLLAGLVVAGGTTGGNTISAMPVGTCNGTWTHAPSSNATTGSRSVDMWYCLDGAGSQTSVAATLAGAGCSSQCTVVVWEIATTVGGAALDTGATPSSTITDAACTACAGTALNLSANPVFIAAVAACSGTCTAVSGTGCSSTEAITSNYAAHCIVTGAGAGTYPATWTSNSNAVIANAVAIRETAAGGVVRHRAQVIQR